MSDLLPLSDAAQRLRRRPGRPRKGVGDGAIPPRALAGQASGHLAAPPLTGANARAVAVVWLKRGEDWLPATARLLGLTAAASYLGVSTWVIRAWLANGVLMRVRLPGVEGGEIERLLIDVADLDRLVAEGKGL